MFFSTLLSVSCIGSVLHHQHTSGQTNGMHWNTWHVGYFLSYSFIEKHICCAKSGSVQLHPKWQIVTSESRSLHQKQKVGNHKIFNHSLLFCSAWKFSSQLWNLFSSCMLNSNFWLRLFDVWCISRTLCKSYTDQCDISKLRTYI